MTESGGPDIDTDSDIDIATVASELRVVLGQLVRRLREQAAEGDLTKSQSAVLNRLEREGARTVTELARAEGVRQQSMAAIVAVLDGAGLVSGSPDPKDGRKTILELTESARERFRTGRLAREDWLTQAMNATLTPAEIEQLHACVELLERLTKF